MALTINQKQAERQNFFINGLHLPTRTIVVGTNSFKDDSEITELDFVDFAKSLHILEDAGEDLIKILLYTSGGDTYLGLAMYDAIKACKSPVEIRAIGQCMSAGTVVLQAGDYRYAYPSTTFMIHDGTIGLDEVSMADAEIEVRETRRLADRLVDIYQDRMRMTREKIREMLGQDTYMDVYTAKRTGLIDDFKERFDS